jgi:hypothetical protein
LISDPNRALIMGVANWLDRGHTYHLDCIDIYISTRVVERSGTGPLQTYLRAKSTTMWIKYCYTMFLVVPGSIIKLYYVAHLRCRKYMQMHCDKHSLDLDSQARSLSNRVQKQVADIEYNSKSLGWCNESMETLIS